MNLKEISTELNQLQGFLKDWEKNGVIPEIEKEIALDKLKTIYSELKMADTKAEMPVLPADVKESDATFERKNLQGLFYEVNDVAQEPVLGTGQLAEQEISIPDFILSDTLQEVAEKGLSAEEASPILLDISNLAGSINSNAKPADVSFERKIASEPVKVEVAEPVSQPVRQPAAQVAKEVAIPVKPVVAVHNEPAMEAASARREEAHGYHSDKRLGEVIAGNKTSLNETISKGQHDLGTKLQQKPISDLHKAISFNDKFLFIRELFNGDGKAYELAINALNKCQSLDEALIYISDHFRWDVNSSAANLLVELLNRKFNG